jgi:hypothetical protein
MKYKIKLGGYGADIYVHELNEDQKVQLVESEVVNPIKTKLDEDGIAEILEKEFVDDSDIIYTGVYDDPSHIVIEVTDESGDVVFDSSQSDKDWYFNLETLSEHEKYSSVHEEGNFLFVESYSKGGFFIFELETEYFNPTFLSPICLEVGERFNLIVGLCYNGEELNKEFDDYSGKGYYYYLS